MSCNLQLAHSCKIVIRANTICVQLRWSCSNIVPTCLHYHDPGTPGLQIKEIYVIGHTQTRKINNESYITL